MLSGEETFQPTGRMLLLETTCCCLRFNAQGYSRDSIWVAKCCLQQHADAEKAPNSLACNKGRIKHQAFSLVAARGRCLTSKQQQHSLNGKCELMQVWHQDTLECALFSIYRSESLLWACRLSKSALAMLRRDAKCSSSRMQMPSASQIPQCVESP